jgi:hypothetical protein
MYAERLLLQALVLAVAAELRPVSRRRAYGTGSLFARKTARGEETWYGQFWLAGAKSGARSDESAARARRKG